MSANVETMFYVREKPWHGLGVKVETALNSTEALKMAGLDWTIEKMPIFNSKGEIIKGWYANTRSSDGNVLGVVGERYSIVQNTESFSFTDALIGEGVSYETAGGFRGGKRIWMLAKMPERYILGDKFEPYLCFTNTHDGTGAVRACMTPIRVVCQNTLSLALSQAKRQWATPHRGDVMARLDEARETLQLADEYMIRFEQKADQLATQRMDKDDVVKALDAMLPLKEDATDRQKKTVEDTKEGIMVCMLHPDLMNFLNTKWAFINAVSDYVGHSAPIRRNARFEENRFENIIDGQNLLARAMAYVDD